MKSIAPLRNLFVPTLKVIQPATKNTEKKETPYLKAILSATPTPMNAEKKIKLLTPDLNAALRYIKESALLRK